MNVCSIMFDYIGTYTKLREFDSLFHCVLINTGGLLQLQN